MINELTADMIFRILAKDDRFHIINELQQIFPFGVLKTNALAALELVMGSYGLSGHTYYLIDYKTCFIPDLKYNLFNIYPKISNLPFTDQLKKYPFLLKGDKFIIPYQYSRTENGPSNKLLKIFSDKVEESKLGYKNCIFIEMAPTFGGNNEGFLQYITSTLYHKHNYLTENEIVLPYTNIEGIPDFGAFYVPSLLNQLNKANFEIDGGFLFRLALLRHLPQTKTQQKFSVKDQNCYIGGEAKTAQTGPKKIKDQMYKYFISHAFHNLVQITPHYPIVKSGYDYLDFDEDGNVNLKLNHSHLDQYGEDTKKSVLITIKYIIKGYLLHNFSLSEILKLFEIQGKQPNSIQEIHDFYHELSIKTITEYLNQLLTN
ncbi:hypothetical protein DSAG12_02666 [Promethearchaeum syntrophicum]|uniref:Uncharacterized protein n=1 Tax=Promethearchaeum syntrophicum TaxID=2594042 RepID=A0A5B9DDN7_9ARCH|nr:hypothetical protein [Candidatus Prometheoarchaeum syntrophicum]QEE16836.1 hypothetical protein DSAG12_02666 [Candidatus Prometheoarchaeum syntrophicum]